MYPKFIALWSSKKRTLVEACIDCRCNTIMIVVSVSEAIFVIHYFSCNVYLFWGTFLGQFLGQYLGNIWGNFWGNIWAISGAISRAISGAIFWAISYNSYPFFFKFQDSNGSWKGWTGRYCGHSCPRRFSNVCGSVPRIWYNSCIRSSRCRQCRLRPRQLSRRRRRPRGRRHWSRRPQRQRHSLQFRVIY